MEFKDISYIIAICEHKNISQAARSLFISQPALSQQLQKIEAKLGKPLFVRSGHTMTPQPHAVSLRSRAISCWPSAK